MVYDVDSIKRQNLIADVIAAHGVALRESGAHLVGHCPFHEDEHPSLAVYPEALSLYCFGCNAGGDVIDLVRLAENLSFRFALERLSNGQYSPSLSTPLQKPVTRRSMLFTAANQGARRSRNCVTPVPTWTAWTRFLDLL